MSTLTPGSSGAPLVSTEGIVGMVVEGTGSFGEFGEGLSIHYIRQLIGRDQLLSSAWLLTASGPDAPDNPWFVELPGLGRDQDEIRAVLRQYRQGYTARDAGQVAAVWPAVDRVALAALFRDAGRLDMAMVCGPIQVEETRTRASVSCAVTTSSQRIVTARGEAPPTTQLFGLERTDQWRIARVTIAP
jgi:hypothetical protein